MQEAVERAERERRRGLLGIIRCQGGGQGRRLGVVVEGGLKVKVVDLVSSRRWVQRLLNYMLHLFKLIQKT